MTMLIVQFALGSWINLYATIPAADSGAGLLDAWVRAITNGPLGLTLHALLGVGIVASAVAATVRATLLGAPAWIAAAAVALVAVVIAALAGMRFVGSAGPGASLLMALGSAVAMLSYTTILFRALPATSITP